MYCMYIHNYYYACSGRKGLFKYYKEIHEFSRLIYIGKTKIKPFKYFLILKQYYCELTLRTTVPVAISTVQKQNELPRGIHSAGGMYHLPSLRERIVRNGIEAIVQRNYMEIVTIVFLMENRIVYLQILFFKRINRGVRGIKVVDSDAALFRIAGTASCQRA